MEKIQPKQVVLPERDKLVTLYFGEEAFSIISGKKIQAVTTTFQCHSCLCE